MIVPAKQIIELEFVSIELSLFKTNFTSEVENYWFFKHFCHADKHLCVSFKYFQQWNCRF